MIYGMNSSSIMKTLLLSVTVIGCSYYYFILDDTDSSMPGRNQRQLTTGAEDVGEHSIPYSDSSPKVGWLLSFPISGSDYIMDYIQSVTKTSTATNYGNLLTDEYGQTRRSMDTSYSVYSDRPNGPFLFTHHLPLSSQSIPTSTHCKGHCNDCYPGRYMVTRDDFLRGCVESVQFVPDIGDHGPIGTGKLTETHYDGALVHKSLLLIRNPFHVIQDRFLHHSHTFTKLSHRDHEWLPHYNMNADGFAAYCQEAASKFAEEESKWYEPADLIEARAVTCHAEFYRYVHWLNNAFEAMAHPDHASAPLQIVHYEDLHDDFEGTMSGILNFYGLSKAIDFKPDDVPTFSFQGDRGYIDGESRTKIISFLRNLASPKTLQEIERYL